VLTEVDHVGIAVEDLEAAVEHYRRAFGIEPAHREVVEAQGVEEVLFRVGTSYIQLLGALGLQTPVGRFLSSHGPGVHHAQDIDGDPVLAQELSIKEAAPLITIVTAHELPEASQAHWQKTLSTEKGAQVEFRVDPEILGGVKVLCAGVELDYSYRRRLSEMQSSL